MYIVSRLASANKQRARSLLQCFSTSSRFRLRSSELKGELLSSLQANSSRLWNDIHQTAQWGAANKYGSKPEETGLSRLTLSHHDKAVRNWFVDTTKELSCKVYVDEIGNTFAIRPGLTNDAPATFVGSHLDSQPMGGRYDGVLGVCAGVEALRVLEENHIETEGPVGVVNWTNEEGARFPVSMMGSGVWAGSQDLEKMYRLRDATVAKDKAQTVRDAIDQIVCRGDIPASWSNGIRMGGYFELHIEQGPYLIRAGQRIGVVEGVQAYQWFEVEVQGRACHTGTTGFEDRADALYWASKIIVTVREIAEKSGGLASVGIIHSEPQSVNTVPEKVSFTLDMRHRSNDGLKQMTEGVQAYLKRLHAEVAEKGTVPIQVDLNETFNSPSTNFDEEAIGCVEASAKTLVGKDERGNLRMRRIHSGAGHDAVNTNRRCPTAMVFVPCRDGVSHHPREWAEQDDCAIGATVLLQSLLRFDTLRQQKGQFD